jgi:L-asparagine transporter-like permease
MADENTQLVRGLTGSDTTLLVIGAVIGTGVFLKSAVMAQEVGSPGLVLCCLGSGRFTIVTGSKQRTTFDEQWIRYIGVRGDCDDS